MIVYDLKCAKEHVFEGWFASSEAYEKQRQSGEIACPHCSSREVTKAAMAPNISVPNQKRQGDIPAMPPHLQEMVKKMQEHVRSNFDYVGAQFPEEARKIHYNEVPEKAIYGESTLEEARDLLEEGIDIMPLPAIQREDA